jgi:hypothetical protein
MTKPKKPATKLASVSSKQIVTPYAQARHAPLPEQTELMKRPDWRPDPWESVRPGADDHKQFKSKGM